MTAIPVILTAALAFGIQAPPQSQQQPDADQAILLTGCVIPAPEIEDTFQLVPAEPQPGRPVGTAGTTPAWAVPFYLLVGGSITAEHLNKTVEVTGTIQPPGAPVVVDPKKTGDTTMRTGQAAAPVVRLQVRTAKIVAAACTPKKAERQDR